MAEVDPDAAAGADAVLSRLPDGALVLVDGLVAGRVARGGRGRGGRLRIVVLAHMVSAAFPDADPRAVEGERRALRSARRVIATSEWTRSELVRARRRPAERVVVATPGRTTRPSRRGTPTGGALLCVGVVAPHKGQDVLVEALATLGATATTGPARSPARSTPRPDFARPRRDARGRGRPRRPDHDGGRAHRGRTRRAPIGGADLLVAPSRAESYGMAIADALRRGIPVVASDVGGIPQTVAASRAAVLVPPDEPARARRRAAAMDGRSRRCARG